MGFNVDHFPQSPGIKWLLKLQKSVQIIKSAGGKLSENHKIQSQAAYEKES